MITKLSKRQKKIRYKVVGKVKGGESRKKEGVGRRRECELIRRRSGGNISNYGAGFSINVL